MTRVESVKCSPVSVGPQGASIKPPVAQMSSFHVWSVHCQGATALTH